MVHQIQVTFQHQVHLSAEGEPTVVSVVITSSLPSPSAFPWAHRTTQALPSEELGMWWDQSQVLEQPLQLIQQIRKLSWAGDVLSSCALWAPSHLPTPHAPATAEASEPPFSDSPTGSDGMNSHRGPPEAQEPGLAHRCDVFGPSSVSKK